MKKVLTILIIFMLMFTVTGCNKESEKKELTDAEKFKQEYEKINGEESYGKKTRTVSIPTDNPFIYKEASDIVEMMDNEETFLVYFGFNSCPWCRSVIEELIKIASDNNLEKIYYVDVKDIRDVKEIAEDGKIKTTKEGSKDYYKLLEKMDSVLDDYTLTNEDEEEISAEEKRIYAPNVVAVIDGKAKEMSTGTPESLKDPFQELTNELRKEIYNEFKCLIKCVNKNQNMCTKNAC